MAKLLIAVKSEIISAALAEALPQHQVHSCHTGTAALALLESLRPDIFIVELSLPVVSGLAVLRHTRCKPPVILALTNLINHDVLQAAADAGVQDMLLLPCPIACILRHLDGLIEIPTPQA